MASVQRVSEVVYHRVNEIIGHHEQVKIRRDFWDILDIIANHNERDKSNTMASGSMREGFDMNGSDYDIMIWSLKDQVICDLSQAHLYNFYTDYIILMEDQYTRPGFVLLRLLNNICTWLTSQSVLRLNDRYYISSFMYRHVTHSNMYLPFNITVHGPCISGSHVGFEYDFALCFSSEHWPPQAYHWIERCRSQRWPSPSVLHKIIQGGCHFMAIGAKNSPSELLEWRLSFSQAEHKLVHSMNHCQFLVYGLLKLFLKEVLNKGIPEDNKLMCSYFMKTAIFWEIQANVTTQWNRENFLYCFWKCYKCLMKWVYNQYCPNFFVPQNNMFYPKITGTRQQHLFCQMLNLYNEGLKCLLRCSSIHEKLYSALTYRRPIIDTCYFSEFDHDLALHRRVGIVNFSSKGPIVTYQKSVDTLNFLITKLSSSISQAQRLFVYKCITRTFQNLAFLIQSNTTHETNTEIYTHKKQGARLMEVITKNGWVTDIICLAMYCYNDGRYRHCLHLLQEAKNKLYRPYVMYLLTGKLLYTQTMCGKSMSTKIKEGMVDYISIPVITKFPELSLELRVAYGNQLIVSPFALLHFLSFLCYYHLGSVQQQQQSLSELYTLVLWWGHDLHKDEDIKEMAWEMLGICYQLNKHPSYALECFWEAHRCPPINGIQQAALYRIQAMITDLLNLNK